MRPLSEISPEPLRDLRGVLFDLDDTVLSHGVLTREAYDAIWSLHGAGFVLVAVTGRPSGWGEVIARQWPVEGAVTENGAVHVVRDGSGVSVDEDGAPDEIAARKERLASLVRAIARAVPAARLADDNHARRSDVAWDIGERDALDADTIRALEREIVSAGARTTRSSVHLHASFERDDKASGTVRFLRTRLGEDPGRALGRFAFVGDSGNDAACFSAFRVTFGVANVRTHVRRLPLPPRWIASRERGAGFAEIARVLVAARA
ncbi:MAG: HAD-IIB family hydrolase [Polyangiaceae bacterium]|nr:HAD-IIB family hydrolase [Polyangiaceae bacterium]